VNSVPAIAIIVVDEPVTALWKYADSAPILEEAKAWYANMQWHSGRVTGQHGSYTAPEVGL
jgi:hypothetical protein